MVSTTDPLFVVAYNYTAYVNWCQAKGHRPHNGSVRYVRDVNTLRGQQDIRILFLYGWQERKDGRQIYNRAMIVGRRP